MPKLSGLFDSFDNLDQISPVDIASFLKPTPQLTQIENYVASKILYPQAIPITKYDMELDLAILREALRINAPKVEKSSSMLGENPFLNVTLRKILIPQKFLNYVPNLSKLTWAFIDGLLKISKREDFFEDLWTVILTDDIEEIVGTVILPEFQNEQGKIEVKLGGATYNAGFGALMVIPCPKQRCEVAFKLEQGKILGKKEVALEVYGGRLGLMIDGRGR